MMVSSLTPGQEVPGPLYSKIHHQDSNKEKGHKRMVSHDYVDIDSVDNQDRHDSIDSGATEYFRMRMPLPSPPSPPSLSQLIGSPPASPSISSVNAFPRGHHSSFKIPRSTPHRKRSNSSPVLTKNSFRGRPVSSKHNTHEMGSNKPAKQQSLAKRFLKTDIVWNLKSVIFLYGTLSRKPYFLLSNGVSVNLQNLAPNQL